MGEFAVTKKTMAPANQIDYYDGYDNSSQKVETRPIYKSDSVIPINQLLSVALERQLTEQLDQKNQPEIIQESKADEESKESLLEQPS